jgi:HTH-type transcriptional regulator/antitoxin HigA
MATASKPDEASSGGKASASYLKLVRDFPLRVIRSKSDHSRAVATINKLIVLGRRRDQGQTDYLETLVRLVEDYERETRQRFASKATGADVVRLLLDSRGMRASDLGKLIGKSTATMVLKGDRELSKSHIRKLAGFFGVSPAVFI